MSAFATRPRGRAAAALRVARRVTRFVTKGRGLRVVGQLRGLESNVLGYLARYVASYGRGESFV